MCPYNVCAAPASFETTLVGSSEAVDFVSDAAQSDDGQDLSDAVQQGYRPEVGWWAGGLLWLGQSDECTFS